MWENRVEELDSNDSDTQGVGLHFDYKRFSSDTLQFTGIDLGGALTTRARKPYTLQDSSGDSAESEFEGTDALQVTMRDKEEALEQSALARIRRAQEKGKKEVKLNKAEVDALERRRKRMQAEATKNGSGSSGGSETERRRRSDRNISIPIAPPSQPNSRPSSRRRAKSTSKRAGEAPPVMLVAGPDGLVYAPSGSYTPPLAGSHNSPTRPRAATTQQLRGSAPPAYFTYTQPRQVSEGTRPPSSSSISSRRPLPDDENWEPSSSRRSSASSLNYTLNPFDYQISSDAPPPIPAQYLQTQGQPQAHRNVSGPAEVNYSSVRRSMQPPTMTGSGSYSTGNRASTSDPSIPRRRADYDYEYDSRDQGRAREREREDINLVSSSEDEEDESDDLGNGVQVFVDEREERARERERTREREREGVSRKPVGGDGRGSARRKTKR
ncbi:hypothetical protein BDZ45DRAFT_747000 [Acephala macrosclerotiorum]|nr:hypothetical protein BDZ45DRAFT_747000 [Acephala macrosclerotiorum]